MKNKKTLYLIILLLIIIFAVILNLKQKNSSKNVYIENEELSVDQEDKESDRKICYIRNTEDGSRAGVLMSFSGNKGENVKGEYYWYSSKTDSKTGIFVGMAGPVDPYKMARQMDGFLDAKSEGMTIKEEIRIVFGEGVANVDFGIKENRGDGVFVYVNREDISYSPTFSQTDCEDKAFTSLKE